MAKKTNAPAPIVAPSEQSQAPYYLGGPEEPANPVGSFNPLNATASNPTTGTQPLAPISTGVAAPPPPNNTAPIGQVDTTTGTPVQQSAIPVPIGTQQQQSSRAISPTALGTMTPGEKTAVGIAGAAQGGINAASQVQPTTSAGSAVGQTLAAGVTGAAVGTEILPGWGTAIGGAVGLVAGGLNAYFGLSSARAQQRKQDKAAREAAAWNKHVYEQNRADQMYQYNTSRGDSLEQLRYNRKQAAIQSQWAAMTQAHDLVNGMMNQNANYKTLLMSQTR